MAAPHKARKDGIRDATMEKNGRAPTKIRNPTPNNKMIYLDLIFIL